MFAYLLFGWVCRLIGDLVFCSPGFMGLYLVAPRLRGFWSGYSFHWPVDLILVMCPLYFLVQYGPIGCLPTCRMCTLFDGPNQKLPSEFPSSSLFGITGFPLFYCLYVKLACRFPRRGSSRQHEKSNAIHRLCTRNITAVRRNVV